LAQLSIEAIELKHACAGGSPAKSLRNTNGFEALGSKNLTEKL
jgi:hypothetical protein